MAKALLNITIICYIMLTCGCSRSYISSYNYPKYNFVQREIAIDGQFDDWHGVHFQDIHGSTSLWFGQGMKPEHWKGNNDLSYRWAGAWYGNKLYFIFMVRDDVIAPSVQQNSFLNDCIEILLDHSNSGGPRFIKVDEQIQLRGYEMHFLPSDSPLVFIDDSLSPMYPIHKPQNELFKEIFNGETAVAHEPTGYIMEIGFEIPGLTLGEGTVFGIDTAVCDDDGRGRKSLQTWSGNQCDFWLTMDHYGKIVLVK